MSFDAENKEDKAQLYQVLKAVAKLAYGDTVELVIDRAVGQPIPRGLGATRNLRRGEYDSLVAQITHRWVEKFHFTLAHEVAPDLFPNTPVRQWRKILNERAGETGFNLVLVPSTFGALQRESEMEKAEQVIKLGQKFCLKLESNIDCHAIALQGRGDHWNVIGLGDHKTASAVIQTGINHLPQLSNGQLDPLCENSDEGITDFVMITAATDRIPLEVERLIKWVNENECNIHLKVVKLER